MARPAKVKVLLLAAEIVGGRSRLRILLKVPASRLAAWLAGAEVPAEAAFLRSLEIVLDELDAGAPRLRAAARAKRGGTTALKPRISPRSRK